MLQDGRKLGFGGMHGIPMVASSPVRHESSIGMTPLEVQAYQPPWKALSDFALHTDLDRLDPNTPSFHHLVSQVINQNFQYNIYNARIMDRILDIFEYFTIREEKILILLLKIFNIIIIRYILYNILDLKHTYK